MNQYIANLVKYQGLDDYLNSEHVEAGLLQLSREHNVDKVSLGNVLYDLVESDFNFDLLDSFLQKNGISGIKLSRIGSDLLGSIVLPIASTIVKDVNSVLVKRGTSAANYKQSVDEFNRLREDLRMEIEAKYLEELEGKVNIKEESDYVMNLFEQNILLPLDDYNLETIDPLNAAIVFLLNSNPNLKDELTKTLLTNDSIVTSGKFYSGVNVSAGTVKNWLNEFIKLEGGGYFDSLGVSGFIIKSSNAKNLSQNELRRLRRLLFAYRAIHFFPRPFIDSNAKVWRIFTVDEEKSDAVDAVFTDLNKPNVDTSNQKNVIDLRLNAAKTVSNTSPKLSPDQEKRLADLMALANTYEAGSLERRAVEEEIKRMNGK